MVNRVHLAIVLLGGCTASARGAVIQFFGEDLNTTENPATPADDPQRIPTPNADAARAQFLSSLSTAVGTESIEAFSEGQAPATLTFGSDTATISGTTVVKDIP